MMSNNLIPTKVWHGIAILLAALHLGLYLFMDSVGSIYWAAAFVLYAEVLEVKMALEEADVTYKMTVEPEELDRVLREVEEHRSR